MPTNAFGGLHAGSETLICPKCQAPMEKVTFGTTEIDRCEECGGLWFDHDEKDKLAARSGTEVLDSHADDRDSSPGDVRKMKCPRCQGPMVTTEDPDGNGVEFEICAAGDGAFFDAGEFKQYKAEGLTATLGKLWRSITE